jgi:hypothetical protein
MSQGMTRQKVWENSQQKQAVMSADAVDLKKVGDKTNVSFDGSATFIELVNDKQVITAPVDSDTEITEGEHTHSTLWAKIFGNIKNLFAFKNRSDGFATAAQGMKADTALQNETDPTVPAWAKGTSKPSYNFSEVGNKPTTLAGYGITDAIPSNEKAAANGVATLDNNGKIPLIQLNDTILGQMVHAGEFNATTAVAALTTNGKIILGTAENTITLTNDTTAITGYTSNEGNYYVTQTTGTFAGITFAVGDWLVANASSWTKVDNTDAVTSVAGKTGAVTLTNSDVGLGNVSNDQQVIASAKGEAADKELSYGGTFKVLQTTTVGTVDERVMTMPAEYSLPATSSDSLGGLKARLNSTTLYLRNDNSSA